MRLLQPATAAARSPGPILAVTQRRRLQIVTSSEQCGQRCGLLAN
jgi:hypothetical protein